MRWLSRLGAAMNGNDRDHPADGIASIDCPDQARRDRRWFIASKLSVDRRPHERLLMATVDLDTGERRVFGFSIVRGGSFWLMR
jgi:hypothetical protein